MKRPQKSNKHMVVILSGSYSWVLFVVLILTSILLVLAAFVPFVGTISMISLSVGSSDYSGIGWKDYTLAEAVKRVAGKEDKVVIVCTVSEPYWPLMNNWLISVKRQKQHEKVLVIAEDYNTLFKVNERWPGHAVLVPPVPDAQSAHDYGSQGFYNFTSRRPRYLLQILELGYSVLYNDVDLVWMGNPFPFLQQNHDIYFSDDTFEVKPLNHSHNLPPPGRDKRTNICSCIIYMHPTVGAKLIVSKWIEEILSARWTSNNKANDQPAFNFALMKTVKQVDMYLLPQVAFPTGGVFFMNNTWAQQHKAKQVIIHNNYIVGFQNKIKRFQDHGLWLVDDHFIESPVGDLSSP